MSKKTTRTEEKNKNEQRSFYLSLYDENYPGLEYDFVRLCERFKASFNFDFAGKSLDRILEEFAEKPLPNSMQQTINALRYRKVFIGLDSTTESLTVYGEVLRKDLDDFAGGDLAHVVTVRVGGGIIEIRVELREAGEVQENAIKIECGVAVGDVRGIAITPDGATVSFARFDDQFNFSPAFAQTDANEIFSFVLAHSGATVKKPSENVSISKGHFQSK